MNVHLKNLVLATVVFVALWMAIPAAAQSDTATLSGTVMDSTGAVLPDVQIVARNMANGLRRQVKTNHEGIFVVPMLPPGTYSIMASRTGFANIEVPDVVLNANDRRVLQLRLQVGGTHESVTVAASGVEVETSPATGTTIDQKLVETMPLNGRTLQALISLTPGVVTSNAAGSGQFSVNGMRSNFNYFTVDGVSANIGVADGMLRSESSGALPGWSAMGMTNNLVSVDALQELRVSSSTYSAEFGRQPGGQVQLTTKSGGNSFHGTAFEYVRNDMFDAFDWFLKQNAVLNNAVKKPPLRQNNFGATLGGPIIKDKLFFFASYEGLRLRQPNSNTFALPSNELRADAPAALKPLLNAFPVALNPEDPAKGGVRSGVSSNNYIAYSSPSQQDASSIRIDWAMHPKLTVFGRYNYAPSSSGIRALATLNPGATHTTTVTGGATWMASNSLTNEFRFNWSRNTLVNSYEMDNFGGAVVPLESDLFPAGFNLSNAKIRYSFLGKSTFNLGDNRQNLQRQFNVVNNVSWLRGSHLFKMGGDYRRLAPVYGPIENAINIEFATAALMLQPGGPRATKWEITTHDPVTLINQNLSLYAQDTWKATSNLTLDYGVRWDFAPVPDIDQDPGIMTVLNYPDLDNLQVAPVGTPLYPTQYTVFSPRFGAAYNLITRNGYNVVVRGGYGLYYDIGQGSALYSSTNMFPHYRKYGVTYDAKNPVATSIPFPIASGVITQLPEKSITPPFATSAGAAFSVVEPGYTKPRTHQWNVSVEQSMGSAQKLTVSYLGNAGRRLLRKFDHVLTNHPTLGSARLMVTTNAEGHGDFSDYHALQTQYMVHAKAVTVLTNWTWSHAIDTNDSDYAVTKLAEEWDQAKDRGTSSFDRRHMFNVAITYDVPRLKADAFGWAAPVIRGITNGWSLQGIAKAQTAAPLDVTVTRDIGFGSYPFRVDGPIAGVPLWIEDTSKGVGGGRRLNPDAFSIPVEPRNGSMARNSLRGNGAYQIDFALGRTVNLVGEKVKMEFRAEAFNVLNHPLFRDPVESLGSISGVNGVYIPGSFNANSTFGKSATMLNRAIGVDGLNSLYAMGGPRSFQFGIKLRY
ncbi:MAG TPA: TonB-dependent receptor [Clostridia bacterium]|nr:TonB-dependent receptor [Clostridia bacterium]